MPAADELERLTEAVDRLIVRLPSLRAERDGLAARILEFEQSPAVDTKGAAGDEKGHDLLRLHSARLLRERQELRRRIAGVLDKLETMQQ